MVFSCLAALTGFTRHPGATVTPPGTAGSPASHRVPSVDVLKPRWCMQRLVGAYKFQRQPRSEPRIGEDR
jgi:hypothetical protein